jgi:hypothetical protein
MAAENLRLDNVELHRLAASLREIGVYCLGVHFVLRLEGGAVWLFLMSF